MPYRDYQSSYYKTIQDVLAHAKEASENAKEIGSSPFGYTRVNLHCFSRELVVAAAASGTSGFIKSKIMMIIKKIKSKVKKVAKKSKNDFIDKLDDYLKFKADKIQEYENEYYSKYKDYNG